MAFLDVELCDQPGVDGFKGLSERIQGAAHRVGAAPLPNQVETIRRSGATRLYTIGNFIGVKTRLFLCRFRVKIVPMFSYAVDSGRQLRPAHPARRRRTGRRVSLLRPDLRSGPASVGAARRLETLRTSRQQRRTAAPARPDRLHQGAGPSRTPPARRGDSAQGLSGRAHRPRRRTRRQHLAGQGGERTRFQPRR